MVIQLMLQFVTQTGNGGISWLGRTAAGLMVGSQQNFKQCTLNF